MKELALKKDVDLLLVDTGDLHDGTGLSDGFSPGDLDAHDVSNIRSVIQEQTTLLRLAQSNQLIKRLPYDVLTIGK